MIQAKTLVRLGGTVEARLPLSVFTPRVKKVVSTALMKGYLAQRSGNGGILYDTLTDKFGLPAISFALRGKNDYWRDAEVKNIRPEMHQALSDWWKADRVAFRMENGEKWQEMVDQEKRRKKFAKDWPKDHPGKPVPEWYLEPDYAVTEPDWTKPLRYNSVRILCKADVDEFHAVGVAINQVPDYVERRAEAIALIEANAVLEVQCTA